MNSRTECLLAIFKVYRELVRRPVTMQEVAEWQIGRGLATAPKKGDPIEIFRAFETKLDQAKAAGLLPDNQSPERLRGQQAADQVS